RLREEPGVRDVVQLRVQNTGTLPWLAHGSGRVTLGYRWRNIQTAQVETGPITMLPHDVKPGQVVEVGVPFQTPAQPGKYFLFVELYVRKLGWFGNAGVRPVAIEAEIESGTARSVEKIDSVVGTPNNSDHRVRLDLVPRADLWNAAIKMFKAHPFGVGPDNYRLLYGRFLGVDSWNTKIHSNNLYVELLAGSGILGLSTFILLVLSIPHRVPTPSVMANCVFLIHGLFDVFLMTTPIYFAFWILAGTSRDEVRSARLQEGF